MAGICEWCYLWLWLNNTLIAWPERGLCQLSSVHVVQYAVSLNSHFLTWLYLLSVNTWSHRSGPRGEFWFFKYRIQAVSRGCYDDIMALFSLCINRLDLMHPPLTPFFSPCSLATSCWILCGHMPASFVRTCMKRSNGLTVTVRRILAMKTQCTRHVLNSYG